MQNTTDKLMPDGIYHVYNRANGNEPLFVSEENYVFFIRKYQEFILPVADTFCYCLMPNHFHFLIQIKPEDALKRVVTFPKFETLEKLVSKHFSNFFSSYTQAFNKQQNRQGSLFMKNFKRKQVQDEHHYPKLVHYIHFNPVQANLCKQPEHWPYSSYAGILNGELSFLKTDELLRWFGGLEYYKAYHVLPIGSAL
ncbi:MAG: transposase [Sediminibacterium sp.]|nr:transposase [Sediminibacterium sp.]